MIMSARLPAMQIFVSIGAVGASPQIGEILPPIVTLFWLSCSALSCPYLFLDPTLRSMVLLGVRTMGDNIWESYAPKLPKNGREEAISSQNDQI